LDGQKLWTGVIGRVVKINYFFSTGRVEWYSVCRTRIRILYQAGSTTKWSKFASARSL